MESLSQSAFLFHSTLYAFLLCIFHIESNGQSLTVLAQYEKGSSHHVVLCILPANCFQPKDNQSRFTRCDLHRTFEHIWTARTTVTRCVTVCHFWMLQHTVLPGASPHLPHFHDELKQSHPTRPCKGTLTWFEPECCPTPHPHIQPVVYTPTRATEQRLHVSNEMKTGIQTTRFCRVVSWCCSFPVPFLTPALAAPFGSAWFWWALAGPGWPWPIGRVFYVCLCVTGIYNPSDYFAGW